MINPKESFFLVLLAVITLFGCVSQQQYRQQIEEVKSVAKEDGPPCKQNTEPEKCEAAEENKEPQGEDQPYFLGIVEFKDSGLLFNPNQFDFIIKSLTDRISGPDQPGAIVLAFAHGWSHNAEPSDKSLDFFRELLKSLARIENITALKENRKPRFVGGVYLAWRGHSMIEGFEQFFTFYDRKATAHRIGEREATQTLLRLRNAVYGNSANPLLLKDDPTPRVGATQLRNRFIIVGHSFGGGLIYSAVSQLLSSELLLSQPQTSSAPPRLADMVILFNPAIEAARVLPLIQTSSDHMPRPKLAIFTSDGDFWTKGPFAWARFSITTPNSLLQAYDKMQNPLRDGGIVSEQDADNRAIGHYDPLVTHFLVPSDAPMAGEAECKTFVSQEDIQGRLTDAYQADDAHLDFGDTCLVVADQKFGKYVFGFDPSLSRLKHRKLAVFNVKMDKAIWDGHGLEPANREQFLHFLVQFIAFGLEDNNF